LLAFSKKSRKAEDNIKSSAFLVNHPCYTHLSLNHNSMTLAGGDLQ